ncbi:CAP domain-containing protein [Parachitinimonas caeni]|uniref:CAP domain-containing protein n=1 Tax=Parachitinimonas caeni TaxID=3031301 RepID=A0ABT7E1L4_9NEIS|nr:CAP domain-containing protein [Parachitinimonas caeni]MDK2126196.1 CAP domain-containing protein [Parachitinimonas caeni]
MSHPRHFTPLLICLATASALAAPQFPSSIAGMEHTLNRFAADSGYSLDTTSRESVRMFYRTIYTSSDGVASGWNGNLGSCAAGDTSAEFKAAILRRINWFRAMAGVPASVAFDATFNQKAQQSAMLMAANKSLSHNPPTSWTCYNATGAEAAGKSNIALGNFGPNAISSGYMRDGGGGNSAVGHRRWILYPQTRFMGTGDVDGSIAGTSSNSLWVFDGNSGSARPTVRDEFVAWPPKGYVPYRTVYPRWSFSYPGADFSAAQISMTENGAPLATKAEAVQNGYGENTLVWYPGSYTDGSTWPKPQADTAYTVTIQNVKIGGAAKSFSYTVTVFDPDTTGPDTVAQTISGSSSAKLNETSRYEFTPMPGATAYQWRQLQVSPYQLDDGAEAGTSNFSVVTTGGYPITVNNVVASGSAAFHLAHVQPTDQTLTLNQALLAGGNTALSFSSRLGYAGTGQLALLEISQDDGASWFPAYQQAGTGSAGESAFKTQTVSLAGYAGRTLRARFRFTYTGGTYYPQSSTGVGWYIDNIRITGANAISNIGSPQTASGNGFDFKPITTGDVLLQVRPGLYDYFSDWSTAKRVTVSTGGTTASDEDRLMNWAESKYPQFFSPAATTIQVAGYTARAYKSGVYLGVKSGRVYVYGPPFGPQVLDVGSLADWMKQVSADHF